MTALYIVGGVVAVTLYCALVMRLAFAASDWLNDGWLGGTAYMVIAMAGIIGIPLCVAVEFVQ